MKLRRPKDVFFGLDGGSELGDELIAGRSTATSQLLCNLRSENKKKAKNKNQTREGKGREKKWIPREEARKGATFLPPLSSF